MKTVLAALLAVVLIAVFAYINLSPAFKLNVGRVFDFLRQSAPATSSLPAAQPSGANRPAGYSPAVSTATQAIPFRGPTSYPHVNGPASPPPSTSTF